MKVLLVMLGNFQSYIIDNIEYLLKHNNNNITIITDEKNSNKFENYTSNISEFYNEEICKENKIIEEIEENITFTIN